MRHSILTGNLDRRIYSAGSDGKFASLKSCIDGLTQNFLIKKDLFDLREILGILCDTISIRNVAHLRNLYLTLIANGVSRIRALRLTETIKNDFPGHETDTYEKTANLAEKLIAESFLKDDRKEQRIKAFIGPTGVGKTTTLAKLAAHYSLEKKIESRTDYHRYLSNRGLRTIEDLCENHGASG